MQLPKILVKGKFYPTDITVAINDSSNRTVDSKLETEIEQLWNKRLEEAKKLGKKVWNAKTYRLNDYVTKESRLNLELSYIYFSVRNTFKYISLPVNLDEKYFPKGFFVSGLIQTADGKYVFGKLSGMTMVDKKVDFIGGVVSPEEQVISSGSDLFDCMYRELSEELNITKEQVADMYIRGLVLSSAYNVSTVFFVKLLLSATELQTVFTQHHDDELKSLEIVDTVNLEAYLQTIPGYGSAVADMLQ